MSQDTLVMILVIFPSAWFLSVICVEACKVASHKWDKAMWSLGANFGLFLMGLAFVSLVWHLPR